MTKISKDLAVGQPGRFAVSWRGSNHEDGDGREVFVIEDSLHHLTALAGRMIGRSLGLRLQPYGVSTGQWPILVHLWETDGLSQRELCERIDIEESSMTRALDGMERSGLVSRERSPEDRRRYHIRLTPRGHELRDQLLPEMDQLMTDITANWRDIDGGRLRVMLRELIAAARADQARDDRNASVPAAQVSSIAEPVPR